VYTSNVLGAAPRADNFPDRHRRVVVYDLVVFGAEEDEIALCVPLFQWKVSVEAGAIVSWRVNVALLANHGVPVDTDRHNQVAIAHGAAVS
jgi:hypothetical protein